MLNILMFRGIGVVKGTIPSHSGFIFTSGVSGPYSCDHLSSFDSSRLLLSSYTSFVSQFLNQVRYTNTHLTDWRRGCFFGCVRSWEVFLASVRPMFYCCEPALTSFSICCCLSAACWSDCFKAVRLSRSCCSSSAIYRRNGSVMVHSSNFCLTAERTWAYLSIGSGLVGFRRVIFVPQ